MLKKLKEIVCAANKELANRGIVLYTWGNVSGIDREKELDAIYNNMPQKGRVEIRSLSFDDKEFKRVYKEYKERQNQENS